MHFTLLLFYSRVYPSYREITPFFFSGGLLYYDDDTKVVSVEGYDIPRNKQKSISALLPHTSLRMLVFTFSGVHNTATNIVRKGHPAYRFLLFIPVNWSFFLIPSSFQL